MATTSAPTSPNNTSPPPTDDVVRRGIPRELLCDLTEQDFVRISRTRALKEAERDQLLADMKDEVDRRKAQIKELEDEINVMGRELRTEKQERTVKCNEIFRKHEDGTGWIYVIRTDSYAEVERRPATAHETQRYLPSMDGGGGLLAQATAKQRSAQDAPPAAAPESDGEDVPEDDDADGEDADDSEDKPKKRGGKKGK